FIRGDSKTPYGRVAEILSLLETAGIQKVGLVTEPHR
ncbi:MAG: protein TolR, partial [Zetaproteobacteria bacterium CG23_combo_of_CG06-09_8_20_14_all_54_7]